MRLGFGMMRLPGKEATKHIDLEQTRQMVDAFIAADGKYFDTAFIYEGSEAATQAALCDRYPRESYHLADKQNASVSKSEEDAKNQIHVSLQRSGAGYIDFYLLHGIDEGTAAVCRHTLHGLSLLHARLPHGHPHPRALRRDERLQDVWQPPGGPQRIQLAPGRTESIGLHRVRPMRGSLPATSSRRQPAGAGRPHARMKRNTHYSPIHVFRSPVSPCSFMSFGSADACLPLGLRRLPLGRNAQMPEHPNARTPET